MLTLLATRTGLTFVQVQPRQITGTIVRESGGEVQAGETGNIGNPTSSFTS